MSDNIINIKKSLLGKDRANHFTGIWVNRNAKRKRPGDVLVSWKRFLEKLEEEHGHKNATLVMHTDPNDHEGPNLLLMSEALDLKEHVFFSNQRLDFNNMNVLYNISDFCLNISYAEGFGLPTLEAMMAGVPIVAVKTGGLTRQVVDHRDGTENGAAIEVKLKSLVGSQSVPYIYEDYASEEDIASGILKIYNLSPSEKEALGEKVLNYARTEFSYQNTVDMWDKSLTDLLENWEHKSWECETF